MEPTPTPERPAVETLLPLVSAIAHSLSRGLPPTVEVRELINDGVVGLIGALRRYDPARGVALSAYAGHRIRGAMLDGLRARDPLPRTIRRVQKSLDADSNLIAPRAVVQLVELEHAIGVPMDDAHDPEEVAVDRDLRRRVAEGLRTLPARDRQVLMWRYVQGHTLRTTAAHLALSVTRTVEIQKRALGRLRRYVDGRQEAPPVPAKRCRTSREERPSPARS